MHLEKTTLLLEKINNLHKSLVKDPNQISAIEKDLLKDYVRALYDAIIEKKSKASKPRKIQEIEVKAAKVVHIDPPSGAQPDRSHSSEENPVASAQEKEKAEYTPPRIIELPKIIKEEIASTPPQETGEVRHEAPTAQPDDELLGLFEDDDLTGDISARLSNSPIKDLTKAISINEKIFTVNELFGGNMIDFDQTLKTLNGCRGFEDATATVLTEKAREYEWANEKRLKQAKKFIKLIRRRYL